MIFLVAITLLLFALISSSVIVNAHNYKYYSAYYKRLNKDDWYKPQYIVSSQWWSNKDKDACYFSDDNSICITRGVYLHNASFTFFDPYTCYWYIKYNNWFKKNVISNYYTDYELFVEQPTKIYSKILAK